MNQRVKRICYVIPSLGGGGTERQLLQLMKGLAHDHDLVVVCTRNAGVLAGEAHRLGVLRVLNTRGGWDFRIGRRVAKAFREYRPDVVHSFMFGFDKAVNVAARNNGVPVVISSRRQLATWKAPRHIRTQMKANTLVDCIVANSQAAAGFAIEQEQAGPELFRVIPNGVDADALSSKGDLKSIRQRYRIPFHTHVIGIVANFSPVKDHDLFLDIAAELVRRRADVHFLMLGHGPLRERIGRRIDLLGLAERVTGLPALTEINDLYKLMAVSVLCSKVEGFPNAVIESMAAGTPIVAAAVGGIPEQIEDGVTGKLVDSRDPLQFADAIEWFLDHPEESRAICDRARYYVRSQLPVEKMVEAYRQLYAELLHRAQQKEG